MVSKHSTALPATVGGAVNYGLPIARIIKEGDPGDEFDDTPPVGTARRTSGCEEHDRLLDAFGAAVQES
jgi:hypothetical protein